jgi:pimeloyl-ACP methyl ester carboxylesterase
LVIGPSSFVDSRGSLVIIVTLIDIGTGPPLVLVPGIQGRWEYQRPAIEALAQSFRVLTFQLSGERGCEAAFDPALGLDNYTRQIAAALDHTGIDRAAVCGVSFGGLAAVRFAATYPDRIGALILASTPGPDMRLRARHELYTRMPWVFGPCFFAETPFRLKAELRASFPNLADRWRFSRWLLGTVARAPVSAKRMAARAAFLSGASVLDDCTKIGVPTLVVTGEPGLDRVVRVDSTMAYLKLIAGSQHRALHATGHLGSVTRPDAFADLVRDFLERARAPHGRDREATLDRSA